MQTRRYSRKREAIMQKLMSTKTHPTAEWIFAELKREYRDIGIATVYRNLNDFCANNEIVSLGRINGHERFDATTTRHDHFVCQDCEAIIDVAHDSTCGEDYAIIEPETGVKVSSHHTTYYGKCKNCAALVSAV